jgi:hypothetical protein
MSQMPLRISRRWLTKMEVSRRIGYGVEVVDVMVQDGLIGVLKVGDHPPRYDAEDVDALVEKSRRPATAGRELVGV